MHAAGLAEEDEAEVHKTLELRRLADAAWGPGVVDETVVATPAWTSLSNMETILTTIQDMRAGRAPVRRRDVLEAAAGRGLDAHEASEALERLRICMIIEEEPRGYYRVAA